MHEITLHLKYAYEAICYHEGHKRSRVKAKNLEDLPLYSLSEARTLADLSAKYLKANLDSGTEIKTLIVLECSETTVSHSSDLELRKDQFLKKNKCLEKFFRN